MELLNPPENPGANKIIDGRIPGTTPRKVGKNEDLRPKNAGKFFSPQIHTNKLQAAVEQSQFHTSKMVTINVSVESFFLNNNNNICEYSNDEDDLEADKES